MIFFGIALLVVAAIVSLIGGVMLLVAAFRVSTTWGVLVLLVPFAALVFIIKYWQESKRAFFINLASVGVGAAGWVVVFFGAASMVRGGLEEAMNAEMAQAQAQQQRAVARAEARPATPAGKPAPTMEDVQRALAAPVGPAVATPSASLDAPDAPLNDAGPAHPPMPALEAIGPTEIARHIGEVLVVTERGGRRVRGTLLAVDREALRIERGMSGGTIRYDIARTDIAEVRRAY